MHNNSIVEIIHAVLRYASTTCAIAAQQNNSGALAVVEPDPRVWAVHTFNKVAHNCAAWSILGVLGQEDLTVLVETKSYYTQTSEDIGAKGVKVKHFTWNDLELETGLKVDTLILDCEGCWVSFVKQNKDKFRNVNKIILGR